MGSATEALWRACLSPVRRPETLSRARCAALVAAVKAVLTEAIEAGGTTVHDYRHVDGSEGRFAVRLCIYGCEGAKCPRCGAVIRKKVIGGRGTCWCPKCQRGPHPQGEA